MVKVDEPSIVLDKIIKFIDDQTKPSKWKWNVKKN